MGIIKKVAPPKHEATAQFPWLSKFISEATVIDVPHLPSLLSTFPSLWPFPRGDRYHWIAVLDRFDNILEDFITVYGLHDGPQTISFSRTLLEKHIQPTEGKNATSLLNELGYGPEGDRELIESVLDFSRLLLEKCKNRGPYNSSDRVNDLLNTTSLSLLQSALRIGILLAQRYHSRMKNSSSNHLSQTLLSAHYNLNLDRVQLLAAPFPVPQAQQRFAIKPQEKPKQNQPSHTGGDTSAASPRNANDIIELFKCQDADSSDDWIEWGACRLSYDIPESERAPKTPTNAENNNPPHTSVPGTPSPAQRTPNTTNQNSRISQGTNPEDAPTPVAAPTSQAKQEENDKPRTFEIPATEVKNESLEVLLKRYMPQLPSTEAYQLLVRLRAASALMTSQETRTDILAIRILAIANLAYVYPDSMLQQKIFYADAEEPKRLQLVYQLAEFAHLSATGDIPASVLHQSYALDCLDALANNKMRPAVCSALNVNVNHGILMFLLRKAISDLAVEDEESERLQKYTATDKWRDSLFSIFRTLPERTSRVPESFVQAGFIQMLVEILNLRTFKAKRLHPRVVEHITYFVQLVRESLGILAQAKGFDAISSLISYGVEFSFDCVKQGKGFPAEYKAPNNDYQIPYIQQLTLKSLFKFINFVLQMNTGGFERLLRNLIDTPALLSALKTVLENATVVGSTIWSGAVNVLSNFLNNEPTSYSVIAEAGLSKSFLQAVMGRPFIWDDNTVMANEPESPTSSFEPRPSFNPRSSIPEDREVLKKSLTRPRDKKISGILPSAEAISAIPGAFTALCLNNSGLRLFQKSDALECFFDIFESPEHIKCMKNDDHLLKILGDLFDEFYRHQPDLKPSIMSAVLLMTARVGLQCRKLAYEVGAGAKLWVDKADGQVDIAGGPYLEEHRPVPSLYTEVEDEIIKEAYPNGPLSTEIENGTDTLPNGLHITSYVFVLAKFLSFYLRNQTTSAFMDAGGTELVVDLLTLPGLPFGFHNTDANRMLTGVVRSLTESKPHLVFPSLLNRAQFAVDQLEPFWSNPSQSGFFAPMTRVDPQDGQIVTDAEEEMKIKSTFLCKQLVNIFTLTNILHECFRSHGYVRSSQTSMPFFNINIAEHLEKLCTGLSRIHAAALWEEILIQKKMPSEWADLTKTTNFDYLEDEDAHCSGPFAENSPQQQPASTENQSNVSTNPTPAGQTSTDVGASDSAAKTSSQKKSAAFRNTKTLRFLLSNIPVNIVNFFRSLGTGLILKRRLDLYQRQKAIMVSDAIASSFLQEFKMEAPRNTGCMKDYFSYLIVSLSSFSLLLFDSTLDHSPSTFLTVVLQSFKKLGGVQVLQELMDLFVKEILSYNGKTEEDGDSSKNAARLASAFGGVKIVVSFFSEMTSKGVSESGQAKSMACSDKDRNRVEYFNPSQFLVELRAEILPKVTELWNSGFVEKANGSTLSSLVGTLRQILEKANEGDAYHRSDILPSELKSSPVQYGVDHGKIEHLKEKGFDEDLVREALYRCKNSSHNAEEYCSAQKGFRVPPRMPPPEHDITIKSSPVISQGANASPDFSPLSAMFSQIQAHTSQYSNPLDPEAGLDTAPVGTLPSSGPSSQPPHTPAANQEAPGAIPSLPFGNLEEDSMDLDSPPSHAPANEQASGSTSQPPPSNTVIASNTDVVTVEDLNEAREVLLKDLIERCLEVLEAHFDMTFQMAELITAAAATSTDPDAYRRDAASTLVPSLLSLQMDENYQNGGKKIAAYAHVLGVVFLDPKFYNAAVPQLKDSFNDLVDFVKMPPSIEKPTENSYAWIGQILLIIEYMLSTDERPQAMEPLRQNADGSFPEDQAPPPKDEPLVSLEGKHKLFDAVIEILPRIGKNESLALSVCRILVILTRYNQISSRLGERRNLQRLFVMMKQVTSATNSKLHSAFMLILRHLIEDEEIIGNIIKKEIISQFESRPSYDISTYMRKFSHAIIRDPETFVNVTGENVKFQRYDPHSRQILTLKSNEAEPAASDDKNETTADSKAEAGPEDSDKTKEQKEKPKADQPKAPVVERPDGVIHYLLSELLSYREVEDKEVSMEAPKPEQPQQDIPNVPDSGQGPPREVNQEPQPGTDQAAASSATKKADQKPRFKPEEHPIFIYRCFLLQCLSELLSSYIHTKVEFINFSRKADPFASTPSKPRAAVLNYLLNTLIPVGTLENDESIALKKKVQTSDFAKNCVVALCAKPMESIQKEKEDEPELVFVRKFVLEHALKAYKEINSSQESLDAKYSRYLTLSDLFQKLLDGKPADPSLHPSAADSMAKMMFEKNFISVLTTSIADIELSFPSSKRAVKYMLRPLDTLTRSVVYLSESSSISAVPTSADEDEISSATSVSEFGDELEVAPNLFRHSTLGMFSAGEEEPSTSEEEESEEDDEMYDDEMDFEQDISGQEGDGDDSDNDDDDDDEEGDDEGEDHHHRHMEGLSGDVPMDVVEVLLSGDENDDDDDDDNDSNSELDQDQHDEGEMSDMGDEVDDEIDGDHDNHSLHGDDDEWESEEMEDENGSAGMLHQIESEFDDIVHQDHPDMDLMRALGTSNNPADRGQSDFGTNPEDDDEQEIVVSENEEDEDPVEEIIEEGEHDDGYDDEMLDVITGAQDQPTSRHRHGHFGGRHGASPWTVISEGSFNRGPDPSISTRLPSFPAASTNNLDGRNPLLSMSSSGNNNAAQRGNGDGFADWVHAVDAPSQNGVMAMDTPITFLNAIFQTLSSSGQDVSVISRSNGLHVRIDPNTIPPSIQDAFSFRRDLAGASSHARDDPTTAIRFPVVSTLRRWQEEAAILFPDQFFDVASRISGSLQRLLAPPAYKAEKERQKKQAEEAKRREKEKRAKEQKDKEEAQKKLEEEAAKKRKEEEERAAAEEATAQEHPVEVAQDQQQERPAPENAPAPEPSEPAPRVFTNIRGRQLDITGLDIDPEYLEALPEDFREEVIMQQLSERRSQAAAAGEEPSGISSEFLEALPPDIREEILQQEAADRRRRQRESARREAAIAEGNTQPEEMDPASFIATLDPSLRQAVLAEQPEEILNVLGPNFVSEARALTGGRLPSMSAVGRAEQPTPATEETPASPEEQPEKKPQRRQIVQMLDKAGIAALLRLMFLPLQTKTRGHLHDTLNNACQNRNNRVEILSMLTLILQDGSNDISALERSFNHLSLRAKQPSGPKPIQSGKRLSFPIPNSGTNEDVTPLLVTQQCLSLLDFLARGDAHISWFFITEHDSIPVFKSRRNKGKDRENRANKFALNYLLSLLERNSIMNSPACMEQLSNLLNLITQPLTILSRREKEKAETEQSNRTEQQPSSSEAPQAAPETQETTGDTIMAGDSHEAAQTAERSQPVEATAEKEAGDKAKKQRAFEPPVVPERNLTLVVHILAARECNAKTFRETLSTINNMSCIPGAKGIIGAELASQCQTLCQSILSDLNDFLPQIQKAENGTDIQGVALWKFSPASSDQAKLLRVLTALDYLFDPNRIEKENDEEAALQKDAILKSFYESASFSPLWVKLSECLRVIRNKHDMLNVATILLPLIESLMVVCKNTTLKDTKPLRRGKEVALSPLPPDTGMEGLFFNFTEEHRKILNELVRQNPKLMIGTFSLLAKNQAVLEFDNKRNYFSKRLHARHLAERQACPPLQLSIRRDNVFLDSFKSLYFKSAQEMKYGKLNIRFHGEEGIDAGGVTREWFHVLARGMFNPNYALFIPVASDRTTFHPNPLSGVNQEHLLFFRFIGRIIGKALYEGRVLDCHFSRAVYKRMLGRSVSVKDMETLDLDYYKSLQWMLSNDITDILTENFAIEVDRFGETQVIDLIPNGRNIPVTEENKEAYVQHVVDYRLVGSVEEQLDNFLKGFHDIIPAELVSIFSEQELELLISGLPEVDVDDWKGNTDYTNYTTKSPQIQWFWRAVRSFDKEERAKLLQFVTGTSKVPLNGFKELEGMNGINRFSIHREYGNKQHLPSAHTCFNQLDLPEYESYEELRNRLHMAMTAGSGYFGFG